MAAAAAAATEGNNDDYFGVVRMSARWCRGGASQPRSGTGKAERLRRAVGWVMMQRGACDRHPTSHLGGGVCATCLRDRIATVWPEEKAKEGVADVIVEWRRRRRRGLECESRSFDLAELGVKEEEMVGGHQHVRRGSMERSPQLSVLMSAQKLQTRSMPLDNRAAEDTASRVIREEADELFADELDAYLERDGDGAEPEAPQRSVKKSPRWVRVLLSPVTSRNKVFPSRSKEDVARKARKGKGSRFASSDWSHTDAASPHWMDALSSKEGPPETHRRSTLRSSLLSWLQDSERTKVKKYEQSRLALSSSSMSAIPDSIEDTFLRDLITVGHLHEIAEEIEEEDEGATTPDSMEDVASFGKFLLSAAQRQPNLASLRSFSRTSS